MTTIMFQGQGIQNKNFGQNLFSKYPDLIAAANKFLNYDISNNTQLYNDNTLYVQPLIYIVSHLSYIEFLKEFQGKINYFIGHSLGEINALLSANVFDFLQGLQIVKKRAELMYSLSQPGGMVALINFKINSLEKLLSDYGFYDLDIGNFNSDQQFVVSGLETSLKCFTSVLEQEKIRYIRLKVSGPFHSRYFKEISNQFFDFLLSFHFQNPKTPVIANDGITFYSQDNVKELLAKQISSSVKWSDSIKFLKTRGESEFLEIGESKILSSMLKNIKF